MQTTIRFFVSFLLCFALLIVGGCGGKDDKNKGKDATGGGDKSNTAGQGGSKHPAELVGKWKGKMEDNNVAIVELRQDGTGISQVEGSQDVDKFTWKVEGGRIHLMGEGNMVADYKLSGSTLTITGKEVDGESFTVIYEKQ